MRLRRRSLLSSLALPTGDRLFAHGVFTLSQCSFQRLYTLVISCYGILRHHEAIDADRLGSDASMLKGVMPSLMNRPPAT
jgi:hypothetical protein